MDDSECSTDAVSADDTHVAVETRRRKQHVSSPPCLHLSNELFFSDEITCVCCSQCLY